jgi:glycosyltransferase involved in cell wall biosynthesis
VNGGQIRGGMKSNAFLYDLMKDSELNVNHYDINSVKINVRILRKIVMLIKLCGVVIKPGCTVLTTTSVLPGLIISKIFNKKSIVIVRSLFDFPGLPYYSKTYGKINIFLIKYILKTCKPNLVITNSYFMSNFLENRHNKLYLDWSGSMVVYPRIDQNKINTKLKVVDKIRILAFNTDKYKNSKFSFDLANLLPEINFKVIGGKNVPAQLKNVDVVTYQDVQDLYKDCCILIMPHNEPEAFGRVALEALNYGIYVISHNLGGVQEISKEIILLNNLNIVDWSKVIEKYIEKCKKGCYFNSNDKLMHHYQKELTLQEGLLISQLKKL